MFSTTFNIFLIVHVPVGIDDVVSFPKTVNCIDSINVCSRVATVSTNQLIEDIKFTLPK